MNRLWQRIYFVYAVTVFIALLLIVFPLAVIASLFGKTTGTNLVFRICNVWADVWFFLAGLRYQAIYETPVPKDESVVFIANHLSYLDGPILARTIRQPVRALGKVETARIPLFGYVYKNAIVTVDRSSPANRRKSLRQLQQMLAKGISVFVFPEGTFNQTGKPLKDMYDGAFRLALETGKPLHPVLFVDSYARMPYESLTSLNPGPCRVVYLKPIAVDSMIMADLPKLKQMAADQMSEALIRYKASWIKP